jgi:hypothetical protein
MDKLDVLYVWPHAAVISHMCELVLHGVFRGTSSCALCILYILNILYMWPHATAMCVPSILLGVFFFPLQT